MRSWMVWGLAVATMGTVAACEVEDPPTEVSVDNRSTDSVTVTLSDASGGSVAFGEVPSAAVGDVGGEVVDVGGEVVDAGGSMVDSLLDWF